MHGDEVMSHVDSIRARGFYPKRRDMLNGG